MSQIHLIQYDKKRVFVSGLFWHPLTGEARHELPSLLKGAGPETSRIAAEFEYDLVVFRTAETLQVGLGATKDGVMPGAMSIAAVVSKTLSMETEDDEFLCAFEAPDGTWLYIAQRGGVILPEGDCVGSEELIRSRMQEDLSIGDWKRVYAPSHWGLSNSTERSFDSFLPKTRKGEVDFKAWWCLSPVAKDLRKPAAIAAGAVFILGVGGWLFFDHMEKQRQEELMRQAMLAHQQQEQAPPPPPPWYGQPRAPETWMACARAMTGVETLWPGNWKPVEASCLNNRFTVAWERGEYGWVEHIQAVVPDVSLSLNGEMASTTVTYSTPLVPRESEPLPTERERTLDMHAAAQKYGFEITLRQASQPPALPGREAQTDAAPKWKQLNWSVSNNVMPPNVVIDALDANGFRVSSVKASFEEAAMHWNLEGVQYVQP